MIDFQISRALALAIGWEPEQMRENRLRSGELLVRLDDEYFARPFSYRDWNVIGPIAARYDAFPTKTSSGTGWSSIAFETRNPTDVREATPQKAIAMAVIEGAKK